MRAPLRWENSFAVENVISLQPIVTAWVLDSRNMLGGTQTRVKAGQKQAGLKQVYNTASQVSSNLLALHNFREARNASTEVAVKESVL